MRDVARQHDERGTRSSVRLVSLTGSGSGFGGDSAVNGRHGPRDLAGEEARQRAAEIEAVDRRPAVERADRGLDNPAKRQLGEVLAELASEGKAIVVATHDVEFPAQVADRVLVMAEAEVVADPPSDQEGGWLTVAEVAAALSGATR